MKRITVLLAGGRGIARQRFRVMLEANRNVELLGEAGTGPQAVALVKKLRPDVLLLDVASPPLDGPATARRVLEALPGTTIVLFSGQRRETDAMRARRAGVLELLLKAAAPRQPGRPGARERRDAGLTTREREVLRLIAQGNANKVTAAELGIRIKTVEKHREHLMEKLDIHETAGLTRYAIATDIIRNV